MNNGEGTGGKSERRRPQPQFVLTTTAHSLVSLEEVERKEVVEVEKGEKVKR